MLTNVSSPQDGGLAATRGCDDQVLESRKVKDYKALLVPECRHRVNSHGASRREVAGQQGDAKQYHGSREKNQRVVRSDSIEVAGEKASRGDCRNQADQGAGESKPSSLTQDHAGNVATLSTQGHADPDFACALADGKRKNAM